MPLGDLGCKLSAFTLGYMDIAGSSQPSPWAQNCNFPRLIVYLPWQSTVHLHISYLCKWGVSPMRGAYLGGSSLQTLSL